MTGDAAESAAAITGFLTHLTRTNYRPATIAGYRRALARTRRLTGQPLLALTPAQADDWWALLPTAPSSRNLDMSALRCFYRWCALQDILDADPTAKLTRPRNQRRLPRPMGDGDLRRALAGADREMTAVLLLAAFCGLRIGEMARIRWQDVLVAQEPPALFVAEGKGGSQRIVPLPEIVRGALFDMPRRGRFVFIRADGTGPRTPARMSQRANAHLHRVGVPGTVHSLRHRYATEVYRQSLDLRLTQELCGHQDPATTAQYVAYSPGEAAGVIARVTDAWTAADDPETPAAAATAEDAHNGRVT